MVNNTYSMILVIPVRFVMMYSKDLPNYANMASIGFHLAEAIGKHFDNTGIKNNFDMSETEEGAFNEYKKVITDFMSQDLTRNMKGQQIHFKVCRKPFSSI